MHGDRKSNVHIVDIRNGSDCIINCQCANEGREVGKMFFIYNIEFRCDHGFARLKIEFDTRGSDLYFGALLKGDKFDKMTYLENAADDIVDSGRVQSRKIGADKLNGRGAGCIITRGVTPWSETLGPVEEVKKLVLE